MKNKRRQISPKKTVQIHKASEGRLTPEQTVRFLEDFSKVVHGQDAPTKLISLRVPENVLNAFKQQCREGNQKYQSMIVQLMREFITKKS